MTRSFAETSQEKLKPIYAEMLSVFGKEAPYCWLGFFQSANLWRQPIKDFRVNQALTLMVRNTIPG